MLNKEVGLRRGKNTISHCFFHEIKGYDHIFFVTDAAFNMYPDVKQKADIISNAVQLAHSFGIECPKVACIAAASIVAKVTRDHLMIDYDAVYPGYHFAESKGYASAAHIEAIQRLGLSEIHRATFCENFLI